MAAHRKINYLIRRGLECYLVIGANGMAYHIAFGQFSAVQPPDLMAFIRKSKTFGPLVDLDTLPPDLQFTVQALNITERFPKCFEYLDKVERGLSTKVDARTKQALNELIAHGLVTKLATKYKLK